jgi:phage gp29-like protein
MIWAGDPNDFGLLTKAAQYVIYKRGNFGDWAQFAEMFGMPFREGRYDDYDEKTRAALEQMMEAYGGANYAILPKNADFKLHDAVKGTAGDLYKELKNACNDEISKIILGNTLTTEQGDKGARSLGEVHMEVEKTKALSDERFIISVLNGKLKAILKLFGFNVSGGNIWYREGDANWDLLTKKWTVISGISEKVPVTDDYIYEEFNIPKPDNYEELKQVMDASKLASLNGLNGNLNDDKTEIKNRLNILQNIKDFFV